ncbi:MAG: Uncharacterized MFS-type transporter, partial [uncultured Rubrobacteraceae bacterium]
DSGRSGRAPAPGPPLRARTLPGRPAPPQGRRPRRGLPAPRLHLSGARSTPPHAPGARRMVYRARDLYEPRGARGGGVLYWTGGGGERTAHGVGPRGARGGRRRPRAVRASGGVRDQQPRSRRLLPLRGEAGAHRGAVAQGPAGRGGLLLPPVPGRQEVPRLLPLRAGPRRAAVLPGPVRVPRLRQPRRGDVGQPLRRPGDGGAGRGGGLRARERGLRPVDGPARRRPAREQLRLRVVGPPPVQRGDDRPAGARRALVRGQVRAGGGADDGRVRRAAAGRGHADPGRRFPGRGGDTPALRLRPAHPPSRPALAPTGPAARLFRRPHPDLPEHPRRQVPLRHLHRARAEGGHRPRPVRGPRVPRAGPWAPLRASVVGRGARSVLRSQGRATGDRLRPRLRRARALGVLRPAGSVGCVAGRLARLRRLPDPDPAPYSVVRDARGRDPRPRRVRAGGPSNGRRAGPALWGLSRLRDAVRRHPERRPRPPVGDPALRPCGVPDPGPPRRPRGGGDRRLDGPNCRPSGRRRGLGYPGGAGARVDRPHHASHPDVPGARRRGRSLREGRRGDAGLQSGLYGDARGLRRDGLDLRVPLRTCSAALRPRPLRPGGRRAGRDGPPRRRALRHDRRRPRAAAGRLGLQAGRVRRRGPAPARRGGEGAADGKRAPAPGLPDLPHGGGAV